MILETKRLILRPWYTEDAPALYQYAKDPDVGLPAGWPAHTSVEHSREVIETVFSAPETYAVVWKESGEVIGSVGLHRNDLATREDEYELGYWIGRPFWGRGLIPEAARAILRHAFGDLGIQTVWCGYYDGNAQSRRVMDKLGFEHHHTTAGIRVALLGETRTGHATIMTKERYQKVELFLRQKQTLDTFLKSGAISEAQYQKSFGDLREFMNMQNVT